jgi:hypothetical protein
VLLLRLLLLGRHECHLLPTSSDERAQSEEASLATGAARRLARSGKPLLELFSWDPPDAAHADGWNARWVGVVRAAETPQDRRGVDAEAPRDLVRGEELFL